MSPTAVVEHARGRVEPVRERVQELVDRSVQGDAEAFGGLYDLFANDVYRYFYHQTGRAEDAEDLVSRTFLRAWRAIASFRWKNRAVRVTFHEKVEIQLDTSRIRRRLDSKLDSIMGMVPAGLR